MNENQALFSFRIFPLFSFVFCFLSPFAFSVQGKTAPISAMPARGESFFSIHSRHWENFPLFNSSDSKAQNILLIHDLFILSFNPATRLPDWMAYELSPAVVWGSLKEERKWKPDPLLPRGLALTVKNYKGASQWGYDKGHLAPKGSFKGSAFAYQAQYLTNLVPQKRDLNRGPWRILEESARRFVLTGHSVKILSGPLYGDGKVSPLPPWPSAQGRLEEVPSGYWKVLSVRQKGVLNVCSFIMPQSAPLKSSLKKYIVKISEAEARSKLRLFPHVRGRMKETCRFLL